MYDADIQTKGKQNSLTKCLLPSAINTCRRAFLSSFLYTSRIVLLIMMCQKQVIVFVHLKFLILLNDTTVHAVFFEQERITVMENRFRDLNTISS